MWPKFSAFYLFGYHESWSYHNTSFSYTKLLLSWKRSSFEQNYKQLLQLPIITLLKIVQYSRIPLVQRSYDFPWAVFHLLRSRNIDTYSKGLRTLQLKLQKKSSLSIHTTIYSTISKIFPTVLYMGNNFRNNLLKKSL